MKKTLLLLLLLGNQLVVSAQDSLDVEKVYRAYVDSVNATMRYQTGTIQLSNGIASIQVPKGYKYLDAAQSNYVLTTLWGNPEGGSLGMLFPEALGPMGDSAWCFNIEYDEIGYVKDDDAEDIDYDELLATMQQEAEEANPERIKQGYEKIQLIGWASKPYYDSDKKILHWAKEVKFGESEENTLNYNVRILGRKGVMVLNAISSMNELPAVKRSIGQVTDVVAFNEGSKYENFNPDLDEVAAYSIGGLVAGKVLAKAGFFAVLLKFWKVIAIAVASAGTYVWRLVTGRKDESGNPTA